MYSCVVAFIRTHLGMKGIPSPADYAARSCPVVWKWLGRPKVLPVSGIWAPPYYFNHFRTSRLESRSVIHRGSYNIHGSLVLVMFCPRERFSQRIRHIQICVYFANLYVPILDMFSNSVKTSLICFSFLCDLGSCALAMAPMLSQ